MKRFLTLSGLALFLAAASPAQAPAANEFITLPVIAGDYYAWAYTEAFQDHADIYGWSTAGVDALGWGLIVTTHDYSGLFFVNLAGIAKTVYPVVALLGASDTGVRERAWIALGTHTISLLTLELLGKPALDIQSMGPSHDGVGLAFNYKF